VVQVADPVVRIEPTRLVVEPGGQAPITVTVTNTGQIVEGFRLTVHGAAAAWSDVVTGQPPEEGDPDVLRVYPGQESTATVVFTAPPASAGAAGAVAFAVLAQSVVDPSSSAAAEGDLEIGRVDGLTASITPVTSRGRWSGRHTVRISNWGNAPATLRLTASDPDDALGFLVSPDVVELPVGRSAVAAVRVRSRRPFLRGTPVRLPFRVVAEPDPPGSEPPAPTPVASDPHRPVLDGALDQRPVLTKGTVALGALGALVLAAAGVVAVTAAPPPEEEPRASSSVEPPDEPSLEILSATTAKVGWRPFARPPDSVLVFRIDPATKDQQPPVTEAEIAHDGGVSVATMDGLPPETEVCFELAAVRGDVQSPRTDPMCEKTPPAPVAASEPPTSTAPETPAPTSAAPTSDGSASASASPTDSGSATASSPPTETTEPSRTEPSSPDSSSPAGSSAPGGGGPTTSAPAPPGTPPWPPDAWVLGRPFFHSDPGGEARLATERQDLETALADIADGGLSVTVLDSRRYPELEFANSADLLVVGPFTSAEAAVALCEPLGWAEQNCRAYRPGPPT
jgi:hypothetical protein